MIEEIFRLGGSVSLVVSIVLGETAGGGCGWLLEETAGGGCGWLLGETAGGGCGWLL